MLELTPRQIVEELDKYIVGQKEAKRAIAVAIRNRWRRQRVEGEMHDEIGPKNMMMIGPTGVGKTEIARRLAALTGAPFIKVDATKYTEVGYYGRDVESMARELVENAVGIVRTEEREKNEEKAKEAAEKRILHLLVEKFEHEGREKDFLPEEPKIEAEKPEETAEKAPETPNIPGFDFLLPPGLKQNISKEDFEKMAEGALDIMAGSGFDRAELKEALKGFIDNSFSGAATSDSKVGDAASDSLQSQKETADAGKKTESSQAFATNDKQSKKTKLLDRVQELLKAGELEDELIPVTERRRSMPVVMGGIGPDSMADDIQKMFENMTSKRGGRREMKVSEARGIIQEQESERLLDDDKINERAIKLAENLGIIFIDEIDKIVGSEGGHGADVSRQGVQRDLLPIVEGTTISTKYGLFSTEHVLFIAAGAFHRVKPSDLTPELQGRFPIRVELSDLKKEDFARILTEPKSALTKQYIALMKTENVELVFTDDAIDAIAEYAAQTNLTTQNIGARRLCTIMELLLEDLNFDAAEMESGHVEINAEYVRSKIDAVANDEDLSKFVL